MQVLRQKVTLNGKFNYNLSKTFATKLLHERTKLVGRDLTIIGNPIENKNYV